MSALRHLNLQRARIERELGEVLLNHTNNQLGEQLGHAGTTIARRGTEVHNWPADELLALASEHGDLGRAVVALVHGDAEQRGNGVRAVPELFQQLQASGGFVTAAAAALADGRISRSEAIELRQLLRANREAMDQLDRDLYAIERGL